MQIVHFSARMTFKFKWWPRKTTWRLLYAMSSFVHYFKPICEFKLVLQSGNAHFGSKPTIFVPCDLEIWQMTLKNNSALLLCCFKLTASFHTQLRIQTGVTVRKRPIWVKIGDFLCPLWPSNLTYDLQKQKGTSSMLLQALYLICHHMWIQTVRKRFSWVLTFVTLTFDLWPYLLDRYYFCHW